MVKNCLAQVHLHGLRHQSTAASTYQVLNGSLDDMPSHVKDYILEKADLCKPKDIYICDGSEKENLSFMDELVEAGVVKKLTKYEHK